MSLPKLIHYLQLGWKGIHHSCGQSVFILAKLFTFICFFRKSYYDIASEKLFLSINVTYSLLSIILHFSINWKLRNITFCVDTVPDCSSKKTSDFFGNRVGNYMFLFFLPTYFGINRVPILSKTLTIHPYSIYPHFLLDLCQVESERFKRNK